VEQPRRAEAVGAGSPAYTESQRRGEAWSSSERSEKRPCGGGFVPDSLGNPLWDQPGWSGWPNGSGAPEPREPGENAPDSDSPGSPLGREPQLLGQCAPAERSDWWTVEPGLGRVVDGFPTRAQRLRAYGNAIVPQAAAEFIKAYFACRP
jgi:hypothetical protein